MKTDVDALPPGRRNVEEFGEYGRQVPDNAPLLGRMRDGVLVAAGHHRNGVLLAPVTADLIADLILSEADDPLLVGLAFTLMGSLKLYGYVRGVVGGRDKPAFQYLCCT